jgi:hypothetical protein
VVGAAVVVVGGAGVVVVGAAVVVVGGAGVVVVGFGVVVVVVVVVVGLGVVVVVVVVVVGIGWQERMTAVAQAGKTPCLQNMKVGLVLQ